MEKTLARRWVISGRVQGVGFRMFAQHKAAALGLTGWARNLEDGRVEVYATGSAERLSDLAAGLHIGPRMSDVRGVEESEAAPEKLSSFVVR